MGIWMRVTVGTNKELETSHGIMNERVSEDMIDD